MKKLFSYVFKLNPLKREIALLIAVLALSFGVRLQAQDGNVDPKWRTTCTMKGNQLSLIVTNYGVFGHDTAPESFEWPRGSQVRYGKKFGLIVGGEYLYGNNVYQVITQALNMEVSSDINDDWWEPLTGYSVNHANLSQTEKEKGFMAQINQPWTWGENFPQDDYGNAIWPGQFGNGKTVADAEFFYKMDDRHNYNDNPYRYHPVEANDKIYGLGIEVTGRGYQFVTPVAEDMIFLLYEIKNVSDNPISKLVTGIMGDPQVGAPNYGDDDYVDVSRDSGFAIYWNNESSVASSAIGYIGFALLETPGDNTDGVDNDGDGFLDESQYNQVDDDNDWQATDDLASADPTDFDGKSDDTGIDGIPETGDEGEGNGVKDLGEPDYEYMDPDEVDKLNLTSFYANLVTNIFPRQDPLIWETLTPRNFEPPASGVDLNMLMGCGYFPMEPQQVQKLTLLSLLSNDKQLLVDKIKIAQKIYQYNFNFLKAPDLPVVQAEARDGQVFLTWDRGSENSFDPITGHDFEGYAVYRSTDGINWGSPITNAKGEQVYEAPIAQFDSVNSQEGYHAVEVNGVRFFLGDNEGLRHEYLDENLINGITYYYAVTAYDTGSVRYGIPPMECSKIIGNPNVAIVTPRTEAASNMDDIYVVPNPYVASSIYDRGPTASSMGNSSGRAVMFHNLPGSCTIRIYTTTGEWVRTLEHEVESGDAAWDLQNMDGLEVATGIYIYHVDAPGLGKTIGRIAVIK